MFKKQNCCMRLFCILVVAVVLIVPGCKKEVDKGAQGEAGKKLKLGVIHLVAAHPDHILLRDKFIEAMKAKGYDVEVTIFDANSAQYPNDYTTRAAREAEKMEKDGIQLIYTTAVYHGIVNANIQIPVIDSVFIAPFLQGLAEKKGDKGYAKKQATGTIFGYSFKDIVKFARDVKPDAKKIAYIYNPKSPISSPVEEIKAAAAAVGLTIVPCEFTTKAEGLEAVKKAQKAAPIAFGTNDLAVSGIEKEAIELANSLKFPIIVGVVPLVDIGAFAAIQYDWARAAKMCADKADMILKGASANSIPMEYVDSIEIGINLKTLKALGIKEPHDWIEAAVKVVQ